MSVIDREYPVKAWQDNNLNIMVVQGENGLKTNQLELGVIKFQLKDKCGNVNIPNSNASIELNIKRPDGRVLSIESAVVDPSRRWVVSFVITSRMTEVTGTSKCEIVMKTPGSTMKFYGINLVVYDGVSAHPTVVDDDVDRFIDGTMNNIVLNVTTLRNAIFARAKNITHVTLPKATSIQSNAFVNASKLISCSAPEATVVKNNAFQSSSIIDIDLPKCQTIQSYAFSGCESLEDVSLPACTSIGSSAFAYCTSLTSAFLPEIQTASSALFKECNNITAVDMAKCTTVGSNSFDGCTKLASINLPECTTIGTYAFSNCSNLEVIDLPKCEQINSYAFHQCSNFKTLIIRSDSLCALADVNAFANTPFRNTAHATGGTLYVKSSLVASYTTVTNWSALENTTIKPIEGSPYEDIGNNTDTL